MHARPASLKEYNLFFFDSETGGLNAIEADMVEVAAVLTDPSGRTILGEYEAKVFPKKPVGPKAAAVNGYTVEKWAAEAIELDLAMPKLLQMAHNAIFTAHNAPFDWAFFEAAMVKRFQRWPSDYHKYDTVAMATPLLRHGIVPNLKLETLTAHFEIEHKNAHTALADVHACRNLYLKLNEILDPVFEKYAAERRALMAGGAG